MGDERSEDGTRKLVLLRHGESVWNRDNIFTGWTDVDLTDLGREEARNAGILLKSEGYAFDLAFTSLLKRAIRTLWITLDIMDQLWIPVRRSWRLNERHYGALQGLNKDETAKQFGADQVKLWRRSYDVRPPALDPADPRYPGHDARYKNVSERDIPRTESLKDTVSRFLPCWHRMIAPLVRSGRRIIISAHGNTFRSLVKYLDNVPDEDIIRLNIPTGIPLVYEFDPAMNPLRSYYLGKES